MGYGDLVPTSYTGRALAGVTCFFGVLGLAFPVGVLSAEFTEVYKAYIESVVDRIKQRRQQEAVDKKRQEKIGGKALKLLGASLKLKGAGRWDKVRQVVSQKDAAKGADAPAAGGTTAVQGGRS